MSAPSARWLWLVRLLGLPLALGAAVVLAAAAMPFERVKSAIDSLAPGKSYDDFSREVFEGLQRTWILVGGVYAFAALVLMLAAPAVVRYAASVVADWRNWRRPDPAADRPGATHWLALLLILLASAAVRIAYLERPMHLDESITFRLIAKRPLVSIITDYSTVNNHMFHTILVHGAWKVLGDQLWAIRLPCLLGGVLLLPAVYWCARVHAGRSAALITLAIVGASPLYIVYSSNARGNSLLTLFSVLAFGFAGRFAQGPNRAMLWACGVSAALGAFTMPSMVFPFLVLLIWLALTMLRARNAHREGWGETLRSVLHLAAVTGGITFMLYTPALLRTGTQGFTRNKTVMFTEPDSLPGFVESVGQTLTELWQLAQGPVPLAVQAVIVLGFVAAFVGRNTRHLAGSILLAVLLGTVPLMLVQWQIPYARVWIWLGPLCALIAGAGLAWLVGALRPNSPEAVSGLVAALAVTLCLGTLGYIVWRDSTRHTREDYSFDDAEAVAAHLREQLRQDDWVLIPGQEARILLYYLERSGHSAAPLEPRPQARRLLLVVNHDGDESAHDTAAVLRVTRERFPQSQALLPDDPKPRLLKEFPRSAVYELAPAGR